MRIMNAAEHGYAKITDEILGSAQHPAKCCLCDDLTAGRGVFIPNNSEDFGMGAATTFVYPICIKHSPAKHPELHQKIEDWIRREIRNQNFDTTVTE